MKQMFLLGLVLLSLGMALPGEGGMFRNLGHSAHPWQFDGREFVPGAGQGGMVVLVRDGYLPVQRTGDESAPSSSLPDGRGAIAGICYIQTAGSKLATRSGALPEGGCRVEILGASQASWHVTADKHGFFTLPLPAGTYEVHGAGSPITVTVTEGRTALVALRTGKRMVD
jgi:hypothetical protein